MKYEEKTIYDIKIGEVIFSSGETLLTFSSSLDVFYLLPNSDHLF